MTELSLAARVQTAGVAQVGRPPADNPESPASERGIEREEPTVRVDSSHTAPWDRVADHGQKVGWQGRDLPPGQVKKQPAAPVAVEPAPSQPTPTTPEVTVPRDGLACARPAKLLGGAFSTGAEGCVFNRP